MIKEVRIWLHLGWCAECARGRIRPIPDTWHFHQTFMHVSNWIHSIRVIPGLNSVSYSFGRAFNRGNRAIPSFHSRMNFHLYSKLHLSHIPSSTCECLFVEWIKLDTLSDWFKMLPAVLQTIKLYTLVKMLRTTENLKTLEDFEFSMPVL